MDPGNGRLHFVYNNAKELAEIVREHGEHARTIRAEDAVAKGWVPVRRELREMEKANMQIQLYSPCACGSGKKLKFCCYRKPL